MRTVPIVRMCEIVCVQKRRDFLHIGVDTGEGGFFPMVRMTVLGDVDGFLVGSRGTRTGHHCFRLIFVSIGVRTASLLRMFRLVWGLRHAAFFWFCTKFGWEVGQAAMSGDGLYVLMASCFGASGTFGSFRGSPATASMCSSHCALVRQLSRPSVCSFRELLVVPFAGRDPSVLPQCHSSL